MPHMYILRCGDGSFYTGSTWNLERRVWEHQHGQGANYTSKHQPVELIYCEFYARIDAAYRREKQVQGWSHRKKQALIDENEEQLIAFSKNYAEYGNMAVGTSAISTSSMPSSVTDCTETQTQALAELAEAKRVKTEVTPRNLEDFDHGK